ncbi:DnaJ domain-containing protein [Microvirga tunisiensis]|uniref:DnaJ domain-containing protein n=2 Tax=Pannonibacter tanglangensis TaxID=2750084 RepID=A0ABW9ZJT5_9HYPH|nr:MULTISPECIES: J domain-containing protein [unclassified Pannonibacter]NBN64318.1 DnaJ domain-containing protein [Pannonibacter sp. XCT-34]NBN78851.1 DnaJ domain-containing protein [Pannonibacter sp. XCT-53]
MRDPYSVLGVPKSSTEQDIKRAFRKLAKQYHPDQNANNPDAQSRFAEINQAYEILGDKDKRQKFDRGEIDAEGKPRFQAHGFDGFSDFDPFRDAGRDAGANRGFRASGGMGGGGMGGGGFDDILNDILGGFGGRRAGAGAGYGAGAGGGAAGGAGRSSMPQAGKNVDLLLQVTLEELGRDGKARITLPSGKSVELKIPAGTEEGDKIRLRGQGQPGLNGGPAGDAVVEIRLRPHRLFEVKGSDLHLNLPLTLYEAVLGAKVRTPTLDGAVNLTIPAGSSSGKVMRLKGKGLPTKAGGHGDLLVRLEIILPPHGDEELETLMKAWKEITPYPARGPEFD